MIAILQLIRWKNLVLISICQVIIIWSIYSFNQLTLPVFFYLICTFCFAAGGNIINDIFDVVPDEINKPHKLIVGTKISVKKSYFTYYAFNFIGIVFVVWASLLLKNYIFCIYGVPVMILLYLYSKYLKGVPVIGNILIASFTSFSLLFFIILIPNSLEQQHIISILALFAFLINWIREIIKDIEDMRGDKKANLNTLPILIGSKRTSNIARIITFITIACLMILLYLSDKMLFKIYIFITLILPLSYIFVILKKIQKKHDFSKISKILKFIIAFGIFTILFT
ncbi:geranylgeranylglycerol-phosphate geranylgeranyltransferase [Wenyingzhuangia sp. chi5]|uniref:Geranylgeranylglycerol-phosphate geranylgeranyltransferase n=1 Tax=Wenyingzhuangia gilva TaxID=3057677 RepID=A0ABT8VU44_9FLAO|nr:geranylgeranylglycerol-phosphate geranylgeranyltransferase [Wenyingzhuangia sp. chi5]MDO3695487.1 geranylgeranylglycerol-phosphate geranylgeranyltransferase [Wenyingzhuangia sp. chi5]